MAFLPRTLISLLTARSSQRYSFTVTNESMCRVSCTCTALYARRTERSLTRSAVVTVICGAGVVGTGSCEYGNAESIVEDDGNEASTSRKLRKGFVEWE